MRQEATPSASHLRSFPLLFVNVNAPLMRIGRDFSCHAFISYLSWIRLSPMLYFLVSIEPRLVRHLFGSSPVSHHPRILGASGFRCKRFPASVHLIHYILLCYVSASVHSIMTPVGSILSGPMMDYWGRRRTLQVAVVPMVTGWLLMFVAPNLITLCIGRMLAGFAVGMVPGPSYVSVSLAANET